MMVSRKGIPQTVNLLRTPWATFRWYARSRALRAVATALVVLTVGGGLAGNWTWVETSGSALVTDLARKITGAEAPSTRDPNNFNSRFTDTDLRLMAGTATDAIAAGKVTLTSSVPFLPDERRVPLNDAIAQCTATVRDATSWYGLQRCANDIKRLTGELDAQSKAVADQRAAEAAETARQAAEEQARQDAGQGGNGGNGSGGGSYEPPAPQPAPNPQPAPDPGGGGGSGSTSMTVTCTSSTTVVFTSNGSIAVSGAASGSGFGSVTVSGGPGNYTASAIAPGAVTLNVSWSGSCT